MQNFAWIFSPHNFAPAERQSCDRNWPQLPFIINTGRQQNIKI